MQLPDSSLLPAPLWLITVLHLVTLTLHFLAMNFLFGGLVVVLFGRIDGKWHNSTVNRFVMSLPVAVAATVTLGVAPLLFLQLVYYSQAYSAAIVSAWFWMGIIVAVIIAYYAFYGSALSARIGRRPLLLSIAAVVLVYVSVVYSSVFSLAERPDLYRMLYSENQSGVVFNTHLGSWFFRWLHMAAGAIAVGGFFVGLLGRRDTTGFRLGRRFFLWGMIGTMLAGMAYLFTQGDRILPLMRSPAPWMLLVAIVLSLGSLHLFFKGRLYLAGILLALSLLGMVTIRHILRLIVLEGAFDPATLRVEPQWAVFAVFVVCFVIAIGLVWYMIRTYMVDRERAA